jgi:hypothetical protein
MDSRGGLRSFGLIQCANRFEGFRGVPVFGVKRKAGAYATRRMSSMV